jgi:pilus assembly protein Flp/PilA
MFSFSDILSLLQQIRSDRRGVTAIEYALIASVMAGVVFLAVKTLGVNISTLFGNIGTILTGAGPSA